LENNVELGIHRGETDVDPLSLSIFGMQLFLSCRDGKRYKLNSLKKLSEDYVRLAQKVHIEADDPVLRLKLPNPTWPSGVAEGGVVVRLEDVSFGYNSYLPSQLQHLTLNLTRGSKVALVGRNGCGKSTLLRLITSETGDDGRNVISGELWKHPSLRIGHVTQYSVEELEEHAHQTVVDFAEANISNGKASVSVIAAASGNIRQYLGGFGLGGKHAHREIGKLSGGERMRLCFTKVLAQEPHLLILDESTNHIDLETLDSMAHALNEYQGAVLMVSHNQSFLSGFCKELWVLDDQGRLSVTHADTESFDEMFSQYRNDVLSPGGASERSNQRRTKVDMARRATKQKAGSRVNTALL
jgi:ATP-binding cassette, subfamily F, member 3